MWMREAAHPRSNAEVELGVVAGGTCIILDDVSRPAPYSDV